MNTQPKTIITYLVDGNPNGLKTVEFSNKLIKGISIPRKDFKEALGKRSELQYSGIYFLIGEDEEGNNMTYIGQATILSKRLNDHYKDTNKDFWNNAICFTYKDGSLNESDINYLEKVIINESKRADRYKIMNSTSGNSGLMQEHRLPDMIEFIEDLKILISNLGHNILIGLISKKGADNNSEIYHLTNRGSNAKGLYVEEGFLVLEGSIGPRELVLSQIQKQDSAYRHRQKLFVQGIIKERGDHIIFTRNYLFNSPSGAAMAIVGRAINGRTERKDKQGKTLDENERKSLES